MTDKGPSERLRKMLAGVYLAAEASVADHLSDGLDQAADALDAKDRQIEALVGALERTKAILTVPAAEYVPAIGDAFVELDAALATVKKEQTDGE